MPAGSDGGGLGTRFGTRRIGAWALLAFVAACDGPAVGEPGEATTGGGGSGAPPAGFDPENPVVPEPKDEEDVCALWEGTRAGLVGGTWEGSVEACDAGTWSADGAGSVLALVNLYREMAGLPPAALDAGYSAFAQACSLLMDANDALDHFPPESWACFTEDGAFGAAHANLATIDGVTAVDLYMIDSQNEDTLGHRRWILSRRLAEIGAGSTDDYSCLVVIDPDFALHDGPDWIAWPPPGAFPIEATKAWGHLDKSGWSLQSEAIDLAGAKVVVKSAGAELPVLVSQLPGGYGSAFAIRIASDGWKLETGKTYEVTVAGVAVPIAWSFTIVDCGEPEKEGHVPPGG